MYWVRLFVIWSVCHAEWNYLLNQQQIWQPAFGLHNLMNRHILKPPSIRQLSYRLHKQNWRLLHFWVFVKVLHTQMHRLLLCLDDKNPFEENVLKVIWCLRQHMPKHKPVTPSDGSHPDLQSLDYRLMLHVDRLVVLCTSVVANFWRLQLSRNLRCTSSSVSQFTHSSSPQRCWQAKLTGLEQKFGSLWIITHPWGGSVRGLNQSHSDTARAK